MEAKTYNDLIDEMIGKQRILILYLMPKEQDGWIVINDEIIKHDDKSIEYKYNTVFNNCAWWCSLRGKPQSDNKCFLKRKYPNIYTLDTLLILLYS